MSSPTATADPGRIDDPTETVAEGADPEASLSVYEECHGADLDL